MTEGVVPPGMSEGVLPPGMTETSRRSGRRMASCREPR